MDAKIWKKIFLDLQMISSEGNTVTIKLLFPIPKENFRENVDLVCRPGILKEVQSAFSSWSKESYALSFMDDDGDKIILDDVDSYAEAVKLAERNGKLILLVEKVDNLKDSAAASAKVASECRQNEVSVKCQKVPDWLPELIEKMKIEVKDEIGNWLGKKSLKYLKKCEKMQKFNSVGNYANLDDCVQCQTCNGDIGEPYFVCLEKKCSLNLCQVCASAHPNEHAMLKLPRNLYSSRRKLAESCTLVLMSKERVHKNNEKRGKEKEKKYSKMLNNLKTKHQWCETKCTVLSTRVVADTFADNEFVIIWDVKNTGNDWNNTMKLECLANDAGLQPVESQVDVLDPLKSGEVGMLIAHVKLTTTDVDKEKKFSTFWILTDRGYRVCSLKAEIRLTDVFKSTIEDDTVVVCAAEKLATAADEINDKIEELFLRSEELKLKTKESFSSNADDDDLLSQYSCVSSSRSSVHDFEVVSKNVNMSAMCDETSVKDGSDSYVLATPLNTSNETDDGDIEIINPATNFAEFFNQLTSSLSTLASEGNYANPSTDDIEIVCNCTSSALMDNSSDPFLVDATTIDPSTVSIFEDTVAEPLIMTNDDALETPPEMFFFASDETPVVLLQHESVENSVVAANEPCVVVDAGETRQNVVDRQLQQEEEERRELEDLARSVQNYQFPTTSPVVEQENSTEQTQESVAGKQQNETAHVARNETITNVLTTALRVSSQALSTVSNVLQTVASNANVAADRTQKRWTPPRSAWQPPSTSNASSETVESGWEPPRAWVPKATQTPAWTPPASNWTPSQTVLESQLANEMDKDLAILADMGFLDVEKNMRLLIENKGKLEIVVSILLNQRSFWD